MDNQRIEEIRKLRDVATRGPYRYQRDDDGSSMGWITSPNEKYPELGIERFAVCGDSGQAALDAEFVAASWSDIGYLLEQLEQAHSAGFRAGIEAAAKVAETIFAQPLIGLRCGENNVIVESELYFDGLSLSAGNKIAAQIRKLQPTGEQGI